MLSVSGARLTVPGRSQGNANDSSTDINGNVVEGGRYRSKRGGRNAGQILCLKNSGGKQRVTTTTVHRDRRLSKRRQDMWEQELWRKRLESRGSVLRRNHSRNKGGIRARAPVPAGRYSCFDMENVEQLRVELDLI